MEPLRPVSSVNSMSKNDPLISFVIPVYKKSSSTFERCLKSLRDMSYKKIEIICVFDGEPENKELLELAKKYTRPELITVIDHGGAPKARNEGYKLTTGKYVSFWDADCFAKPEMAKRWIEEFNTTTADFVYSGYELDGQQGAIEGEPFDPYLLTCANYIATMFPMKREIFCGFDESLSGAQDWDLWLTLVEKGYQGSHIEGQGFITELPTKESISGKAWSDENYKATFNRVKEKHDIPTRDILVGSEMQKLKGLHIAKLINADFHRSFDFRRHDYKLAMSLGYGWNTNFDNAPSGCVKVIYWLPWEITGLEERGFSKAIQMLEKMRKNVDFHFCNEIVSQKRLKRMFDYMGMPTPEILPLPSEIEEAETALPKDYKVLLDIDEEHLPVFRTIKQDLPYIQIDNLDFRTNPIAKIEDYSLLASFKVHPTIDEGIRRFLINGRNVISNVEAPYCGFFDMQVGYGAFKDEMIKRIRDGRYLKFNTDGQNYYKKLVDPEVFAERIRSLIKTPVMELV